jgi:hypothetical protein
VILLPSANPNDVAVFLYENARLRGPAGFSTLGMRIQNEQAGSTSLFAQPMAIEPVPEDREQGLGIRERGTGNREQGLGNREQGSEVVAGENETLPDSTIEPSVAAPLKIARSALETRMEAALASLEEGSEAPSSTIRQGHLALLKRWYYRPEARREGEIFFPDAEGRWPVRALLRGVGRVAGKMLAAGRPTG